jgi:transposase InsO family protein
MDFFVVPTVTFRLLYGFVILRHDRRRVVHFGVTEQPTAAWVAQQLREAFPYDEAPRYLIRDRDSIYGAEVRRCIKAMGIEEVVIAPRSPWQNTYGERLIGTLRRDLLDHVIVLGERHLQRLLTSFFAYYHQSRCHQSLKGNAPEPRAVEPRERGRVVAEPIVGGLHHRYHRAG